MRRPVPGCNQEYKHSHGCHCAAAHTPRCRCKACVHTGKSTLQLHRHLHWAVLGSHPMKCTALALHPPSAWLAAIAHRLPAVAVAAVSSRGTRPTVPYSLPHRCHCIVLHGCRAESAGHTPVLATCRGHSALCSLCTTPGRAHAQIRAVATLPDPHEQRHRVPQSNCETGAWDDC